MDQNGRVRWNNFFKQSRLPAIDYCWCSLFISISEHILMEQYQTLRFRASVIRPRSVMVVCSHSCILKLNMTSIRQVRFTLTLPMYFQFFLKKEEHALSN